jgi:uncharacterized protein YbcV (DUF1398 family)
MDTKAISDLFQLSLAGQNTFGEVLKHLSEFGVQRFHIDLVKHERTLYSRNDEVYVEKFVLDRPAQACTEFSQKGIDEAIALIQTNEIEFVELLARYTTSGVAGYLVFIDGDRIFFYGRNGEEYARPLMLTATGKPHLQHQS